MPKEGRKKRKRTRAIKSTGIYFSDFFGIRPEVVAKYGAFNVSLISDLPLFVDPFLLFNSENPKYQELHESLLKYMTFLRDVTLTTPLSDALIDAWFSFREVKQNWFGFSLGGNRGHGLGSGFARALHANFTTVFRDFGKETITYGSHIEKLCLVRQGFGRDNLSDFTTNLVKGFLAQYTQGFAKKYLKPEQRRVFSISKAKFNYVTRSWMPKRYELPLFQRDYVLLTPIDILTKDDVWINRSDLLLRFEEVAEALPNAALREQLNQYLYRRLARFEKPPSEKKRRAIFSDAIEKHPEVLDYYIRQKEDDGEKAVAVSGERVQDAQELFVEHVRDAVTKYLQPSGFYSLGANSFEEAKHRLTYLKDVIENKGGHRIFYVKGKPIQRESDLQLLYRLVWFATPSVVSREVNDGRGPADFQIARGPKDKTLVEFKLAKNSQLARNLQEQSNVYERASDATHPSLKCIVYFSRQEQRRVTKILEELRLTESPEIVVVDARQDNKPSGSVA